MSASSAVLEKRAGTRTERSTVVIDVGGTKIRAALGTKDGIIPISRTEIPTPTDASDFLRSIRTVIKQVGSHSGHHPTVAIGMPGPVTRQGYIKLCSTLSAEVEKSVIGTTLQDELKDYDVRIINDVTAVGEYLVGTGLDSFAVVNIGTGVGHKVFVDGLPQLGQFGDGGEIGHMTCPAPSGLDLTCCCGKTAHVGSYSSGAGVVQYLRIMAAIEKDSYLNSSLSKYSDSANSINCKHLSLSVQEGDKWATDKFSEAFRPLATAISTLRLSSGITCFRLCGGVPTLFGSHMTETLKAHLISDFWDSDCDWDDIEIVNEQVEPALNGLLRTGLNVEIANT